MVRTSEALWEGNVKKGKGSMKLGSGHCDVPYSFGSRFEHGAGTNPEELIGAAHAGCFNMALTVLLDQAGYRIDRIHTTARVHLDKAGEGYRISTIELDTEGNVPDCDEKTFMDKAEQAKRSCPVSMALAGVEIKLQCRLVMAKAA